MIEKIQGSGCDMQRSTDDNHWKEQFAREHERLIAALGEMTDGGIVERMEHVGTTSVPDLLGQPCVDIALAVWPFPLEEPALQSLSSMGYELCLLYTSDAADE